MIIKIGESIEDNIPYFRKGSSFRPPSPSLPDSPLPYRSNSDTVLRHNTFLNEINKKKKEKVTSM
jgi:hypothetical protein